MYHSKVELWTIRKEVARQLRIIQFEEDIPEGEDDDSDICSRGLEQETKEGRRERQIHRMATLSSVLHEQARQKNIWNCQSRIYGPIIFFDNQGLGTRCRRKGSLGYRCRPR